MSHYCEGFAQEYLVWSESPDGDKKLYLLVVDTLIANIVNAMIGNFICIALLCLL